MYHKVSKPRQIAIIERAYRNCFLYPSENPIQFSDATRLIF